ncbi:hypothetical protein ACO2Q7_05400 [Rathayibacter sp. KR2-224]|uniref:hypothetical protein n=1 Tax=Rathayibacter sp. KR2-224 TaxID=3400913 RepID=UPI003BFDF5AC
MVTLVDGQTAAAMSNILPILLLAFTVEFRRTALHRRGSRPGWVIAGLAFFYVLFGVVETTMVLSIDGHLLPSKPSDLLLGVAIFVLLCLLFVLGLVPSRSGDNPNDE